MPQFTPKSWWSTFLLVCFVAGCTTLPDTRVLDVCPDCQPMILQSQTQWPLTAFVQSEARHNSNQNVLHVYLEGDGNPWGRWRPKANPNSRLLTALHLMVLDEQLSLYINRPCYGYPTPPPPCTPEHWTAKRYAPEVVNSLNAGIDEAKERLEMDKIVLLGHSGGGTLAMLLAHEREDVLAVVTLAANLDHEIWTEKMGYTPLQGSLNPAELPPLPEHILRWHYAGGRDQQVPAEIVQEAAESDPHAHYRLKPDYNHNCCWHELWPSLLERLAAELPGRPAQSAQSAQGKSY